jgi:Cdc6-like AAA superfamily ATPase
MSYFSIALIILACVFVLFLGASIGYRAKNTKPRDDPRFSPKSLELLDDWMGAMSIKIKKIALEMAEKEGKNKVDREIIFRAITQAEEEDLNPPPPQYF